MIFTLFFYDCLQNTLIVRVPLYCGQWFQHVVLSRSRHSDSFQACAQSPETYNFFYSPIHANGYVLQLTVLFWAGPWVS